MTPPAKRAKDVVAWAPVLTVRGCAIIDAWNIRPQRGAVVEALGTDAWKRHYKPRGWRIARVRITEITQENNDAG